MPGLRFHCDKETEILDDVEMGEFAYGYVGNSTESIDIYQTPSK